MAKYEPLDIGMSDEEVLDAFEKARNSVQKEAGKGLSTNDFTNAEKQKLSELENYDDSEMQALISTLTETIASLEARIAALESNGGESEDEI